MGRRFLRWDHDGVLVDAERWYSEATREAPAVEDSLRGLESALRCDVDRVAVGHPFTASRRFDRAWRVLDPVCEPPRSVGE